MFWLRVVLLRVESDFFGVDIYVDWVELGCYGCMPCLLVFLVGEYCVWVECEGYCLVVFVVILEEGCMVSVTFEPLVIVGWLWLIVSADVQVRVIGFEGVVWEGVSLVDVSLFVGYY